MRFGVTSLQRLSRGANASCQQTYFRRFILFNILNVYSQKFTCHLSFMHLCFDTLLLICDCVCLLSHFCAYCVFRHQWKRFFRGFRLNEWIHLYITHDFGSHPQVSGRPLAEFLISRLDRIGEVQLNLLKMRTVEITGTENCHEIHFLYKCMYANFRPRLCI